MSKSDTRPSEGLVTSDDLAAAREEYAATRAAYERAAREGDWDAVRELVKPAAAAANRASAIHDQLGRAS